MMHSLVLSQYLLFFEGKIFFLGGMQVPKATDVFDVESGLCSSLPEIPGYADYPSVAVASEREIFLISRSFCAAFDLDNNWLVVEFMVIRMHATFLIDHWSVVLDAIFKRKTKNSLKTTKSC